jgi:DNA-directed RNA polymerase subunit alpha
LEAFVQIGISEVEEAGAPVLPSPRVETLELTETYGRFSLEPLERGFATTLGSPLRRVLLNSIPGAAVTWVRIEGAMQEYTSLPHVKEDVMEILQRIKAIRLRPLTDRPGLMRLAARGPGDVRAGDITTASEFEIANPDLRLATLDSADGTLDIEFNIEHGKGYAPAQYNEGLPIGTLSVDAIFSPVRRVNYSMERMRVGQVTDYERLLLDVWTDGTISPQDAVRAAAQTLSGHMTLFINVGVPADEAGDSAASAIPSDVYNIPVERLELSSRTQNSLKRAGINRVGEILEKSRVELLRIRNVGEKSLDELTMRLRDRGLVVPESLLAATEAAEPHDDEDEVHNEEE